MLFKGFRFKDWSMYLSMYRSFYVSEIRNYFIKLVIEFVRFPVHYNSEDENNQFIN
jgi:hypothetical protein